MPPPQEQLDHLLWRGVLTHEIFHSWNVEGFRYASAVALCHDVELRTTSGGERTLDDVMRLLFCLRVTAQPIVAMCSRT
jgi:predicted metalloprotease with PDZ domain